MLPNDHSTSPLHNQLFSLSMHLTWKWQSFSCGTSHCMVTLLLVASLALSPLGA